MSWGATELNCILPHLRDLLFFYFKNKYNNQEVIMRVLCRNTWKMNCIKYEGKKIKYVEFVIKGNLISTYCSACVISNHLRNCVKHIYRPQEFCSQGEGEYLGRYTPRTQVHCPPPRVHAGQQAGSTHPT